MLQSVQHQFFIRNFYIWSKKIIILDVNKLTKNFSFGTLFENLSFSLNEGESISIVGPNGCGKSTLLKIIAGLMRADSGTVRIRVKLAILLQQQINTLIFDEPTNHIDIPTKEVLEEALSNFGGTLIFVSHDRYFINKFADKIFEFSSGKMTTYHGNYDYFKQILLTK